MVSRRQLLEIDCPMYRMPSRPMWNRLDLPWSPNLLGMASGDSSMEPQVPKITAGLDRDHDCKSGWC